MIIWQEYIHLKTQKSVGWFGFFNDALVYTVGENPVTNFWSFKKSEKIAYFLVLKPPRKQCGRPSLISSQETPILIIDIKVGYSIPPLLLYI